uniref:Uncharacterized protein n=1 Tax=Anopheles maculatus TaxID=74869 RepID=A0A182S6B8_9DIPT
MAWPISAINGTSPDARHQTSTNGNGFYATSPYQGGFTHGTTSSQLFNGNVVNGTTVAGMNFLPAAGYHPNGNGYTGMAGVNGVMMGGQFNTATSSGGASMLSNVPGVTNPVHHFANFGNPFMVRLTVYFTTLLMVLMNVLVLFCFFAFSGCRYYSWKLQ